MVNRRAILYGSIAVLARPLAAEAQQPGKVYRIGFLFTGTIAQRPQVEGFFERLRELGYIEGHNVVIERREAKGQIERLPLLAEDLVRLKVDAILAVTTPAVAAAKKATQTIPVIMAVVHDPIRLGLVESLARPEGNVTGPSLNSVDPAGKRLQLIREDLDPTDDPTHGQQDRISFASGRAEIAYANETPWHGLGVKVDGLQTTGDMLRHAGMLWTVEKRACSSVTAHS